MTITQAKIVLLLCSAAWLLLAVLSLLPIMMSPMMFDAPEATSDRAVWIGLSSLVLFPIVVIISVVTAWVMYARENYAAAVKVMLLPVLNLFACMIAYLLW